MDVYGRLNKSCFCLDNSEEGATKDLLLSKIGFSQVLRSKLKFVVKKSTAS